MDAQQRNQVQALQIAIKILSGLTARIEEGASLIIKNPKNISMADLNELKKMRARL